MPAQQRPQPLVSEAKYRRSRRLNIILSAVVLFLGVVLAAQLLGGPGFGGQGDAGIAGGEPGADATDSADSGAQVVDQAPYIRGDANDPLAIGDIDAPLVVVEWTDLRCPYCALFTNETLPDIIEEYVDAGKIRLEVNPVAFFGDESAVAAAAALAAAEQGRYFEYLRVLYAAAPEGGKPDMPREKLVGFAEQAGVPDLSRFEHDLDDPAFIARVETHTLEAQQLGVNSVPFFAIEGEAFTGAQPIENFRTRFDQALSKIDS